MIAVFVWKSAGEPYRLGFAQQTRHPDFKSDDWTFLGEVGAIGLPDYVVKAVQQWTFNGQSRYGHLDQFGSFSGPHAS